MRRQAEISTIVVNKPLTSVDEPFLFSRHLSRELAIFRLDDYIPYVNVNTPVDLAAGVVVRECPVAKKPMPLLRRQREDRL